MFEIGDRVYEIDDPKRRIYTIRGWYHHRSPGLRKYWVHPVLDYHIEKDMLGTPLYVIRKARNKK